VIISLSPKASKIAKRIYTRKMKLMTFLGLLDHQEDQCTTLGTVKKA
jgi:hypothetical protein